jgi:hypothetical protein
MKTEQALWRIGFGAGLSIGLGAPVVILAVAYLSMRQAETQRTAEVRAYIEKVRACYRNTPPPRPTWNLCERRVEAAEAKARGQAPSR